MNCANTQLFFCTKTKKKVLKKGKIRVKTKKNLFLFRYLGNYGYFCQRYATVSSNTVKIM